MVQNNADKAVEPVLAKGQVLGKQDAMLQAVDIQELNASSKGAPVMRRYQEGSFALVDNGKDANPSLALIDEVRWVGAKQEVDLKVKLLIRAADVIPTDGVAGQRQVLYSQETSLVSARRVMHPCKVFFLAAEREPVSVVTKNGARSERPRPGHLCWAHWSAELGLVTPFLKLPPGSKAHTEVVKLLADSQAELRALEQAEGVPATKRSPPVPEALSAAARTPARSGGSSEAAAGPSSRTRVTPTSLPPPTQQPQQQQQPQQRPQRQRKATVAAAAAAAAASSPKVAAASSPKGAAAAAASTKGGKAAGGGKGAGKGGAGEPGRKLRAKGGKEGAGGKAERSPREPGPYMFGKQQPPAQSLQQATLTLSAWLEQAGIKGKTYTGLHATKDVRNLLNLTHLEWEQPALPESYAVLRLARAFAGAPQDVAEKLQAAGFDPVLPAWLAVLPPSTAGPVRCGLLRALRRVRLPPSAATVALVAELAAESQQPGVHEEAAALQAHWSSQGLVNADGSAKPAPPAPEGAEAAAGAGKKGAAKTPKKRKQAAADSTEDSSEYASAAEACEGSQQAEAGGDSQESGLQPQLPQPQQPQRQARHSLRASRRGQTGEAGEAAASEGKRAAEAAEEPRSSKRARGTAAASEAASGSPSSGSDGAAASGSGRKRRPPGGGGGSGQAPTTVQIFVGNGRQRKRALFDIPAHAVLWEGEQLAPDAFLKALGRKGAWERALMLEGAEGEEPRVLSEWLADRCAACELPTDEEHLLVCEACGQLWHTHCLAPPLETVPEGEWYCPRCRGDQE